MTISMMINAEINTMQRQKIKKNKLFINYYLQYVLKLYQ